MLKARGIEFCVRLKEDWWLKVKDFTESNEIERIVTFSLPKKDRKKLADYPHMQDATITCRLVKIELETGEKEIFSGKTAQAVKQDFHAKILLMSLCAAYAHPIEEKVIAEYKADQI